MKKIVFRIIRLCSRLYTWNVFHNLQYKFYSLRTVWVVAKMAEAGSCCLFRKIGMLCSPECMSIGSKVVFGDYIWLTAWRNKGTIPCLKIGNNCDFGAFNHISCANKIIIGDNCLTGKWVTIIDNSHGDTDYDTLLIPPARRQITTKGPVIIGENVWLGDKVTVLPGITIGDGAVVAANTVVTKDVPPYSVVGGNPAKVLKERNINN